MFLLLARALYIAAPWRSPHAANPTTAPVLRSSSVHLFLPFRAAGPPAGPRRGCDSVSLLKQSHTVLGQSPFAVGRVPVHDQENTCSRPGEQLFAREREVIHQWYGEDPGFGCPLTHNGRNEDRPALRREKSQRKTGLTGAAAERYGSGGPRGSIIIVVVTGSYPRTSSTVCCPGVMLASTSCSWPGFPTV